MKAVDLIHPRRAVEDAYERLRNAWTNFEKCKSRHSRQQRWVLVEERQRQVAKTDRLYDELRAAMLGQRRREPVRLDQSDMYRLNSEVRRMGASLERAGRRESRAWRQLEAGYPMWSEERVDMYVRETARLDELMRDATRRHW